jgi:hypothetical protein
MDQEFDAAQQVRAAREQITSLRQRAGQGAVTTAISQLDDKLAALEGGGGRLRRGAGAADNFGAVGGGLATVHGIVDSADVAPTRQVVEAFTQLRSSLDQLLARWNELKTRDIPALNQQLGSANLPAINLSAQPQR